MGSNATTFGNKLALNIQLTISEASTIPTAISLHSWLMHLLRIHQVVGSNATIFGNKLALNIQLTISEASKLSTAISH